MAVKRNEKAKNRAFLALLFIIVLGLVFAFLFYMYSKKLKSGVYVFNDDYRAGTMVCAEMFSPVEIDAELFKSVNEASNTGAYLSMEELNGTIRRGGRLRTDVVKGLPATSNLFTDSYSGSVESHLSDNLVSVEIPAAGVSGLSGREVYTGTRVNLLAGGKEGGSYVTEMIFQDVPVVSVTENGDGDTESIFVELQPDESLKLVTALHTRDITVSVIKAGQYLPLSQEETRYSEKTDAAERMTAGGTDRHPATEVTEP